MEPASERDIRSDYTLLYRLQLKKKRGYASNITTLSVFHHLLSFLLIYLLSLAKIRIIFGIPNKEYRRNDIKKSNRLHT